MRLRFFPLRNLVNFTNLYKIIFSIFKVKNHNLALLNEIFSTLNSEKSMSRDVKFIKFLFLLFWLSACGSNTKPDDLISEDKMAKILTEIHILEAQINNVHFQHEDSSVYVYQKMKVKILKTFDLDSATFKRSFKYYLLNPDKMKGIYTEVKKLLEAKKKVIEANKKLEDKKKQLLEDKKTKKMPKAVQKADSLMRLKNELQSKEAVRKHLIRAKRSVHKPNRAMPKLL